MVLKGKEIVETIKDDLKVEVKNLIKDKIMPKLVVIMVGEDSASNIYVKNKEKACEELSIQSEIYKLTKNTSSQELKQLIDKLNVDPKVSGILVQSPLPSHINEKEIFAYINPIKDVDCFNPVNIGNLLLSKPVFTPCTPSGIMQMISSVGYKLESKNCVVIGRSDIVGKPMAIMLMHKNATVTVCNSYTKDLKEITERADLIVSAVGKPNFVTADMVKKGAFVIDVGMNRDKKNKLCGDVSFDEVKQKAEYITPVPGGVGLLTVAMLMKNTVLATKIQNKIKSS